ncbi:MAG: transcriptional repressor LexA [Betaproteobacteria bacterium]|nr:transcriptional repressor LexA [Betaproteobacteria bacterium]
MRQLTKRQLEILELIRRHIVQTGFPPTRAEIARELGFRSPNAAEEHLKAMARKGVLEIVSGTSRGIRINDATQGQGSVYEARESASGTWLNLPLIGRVAAGSPILAQEHVETHFRFDKHIFAQVPDYLLRVRGMSMRDAGILDGDLLAVKRTQQARQGQIVVARLHDEVTVKRFEQEQDRISLWPAHPDYQVIVIAANDDGFALEGIAVGLVRDKQFLG